MVAMLSIAYGGIVLHYGTTGAGTAAGAGMLGVLQDGTAGHGIQLITTILPLIPVDAEPY